MNDISVNDIHPYVESLGSKMQDHFLNGYPVMDLRVSWGMCMNFQRSLDRVEDSVRAQALARFSLLLRNWAVDNGVPSDLAGNKDYPVENVAIIKHPRLDAIGVSGLYASTMDKFAGVMGALRLDAIEYVAAHWLVGAAPVTAKAYKPAHGGYPG